jgi:beta-lactamase regulating signal transducer with metallopeptidase domain
MAMHFDSIAVMGAGAIWALLADLAIKGAIVLAAAWAIALVMRRASAAMRHLVWALGIYGTLALPVLAALLPGWRILPAWMSRESVAKAPIPQVAPRKAVVDSHRPDVALPERVAKQPMPSDVRADAIAELPRTAKTIAAAPTPPIAEPAPRTLATAASHLRQQPSWQSWVLIAWGSGTALMLLPVFVSLLSLWRLGRRAAKIVGESWNILLRELAGRLKLRRSVMLLRGRRQGMPMTWGMIRPKLLLPPEADGWPMDRRRVVLMHELAHIRRGDFLTQLTAQIARAIYWFNPLIWIAAKQVARESEGACDDLVLTQETRASDYAEHLLTVVAGLKEGALIPVAAVAMARSSRLEERLLAILDAKRNRRSLTAARIVLAVALLAGSVLPLAMIRAADRDDTRKPAAGLPASQPSTRPAPAVVQDDKEVHVDALGSVAQYDRVPPDARGVQVPQSVPVMFTVPEDNVHAIVRKLDAHQALAVDVYDRTFQKKLGHGTLVGIDNQIDATTGTLKCKAMVLPAGDGLLFPNQFLNVRLHLASVKSPDTGPASSAEPHREVLKAELEQARAVAAVQEKLFKAGAVDALTMAAARDKVEVLEAELTGDATKVAQVKLASARRKLELSSKLFKAGMLPVLDFEKAKGEVEILQAELAGDPVKVAEIKLASARRQLEVSSALFAAGAMTSLDFQRAKSEVAVAEAKLREAVARAGHAGPLKEGLTFQAIAVDSQSGAPIPNVRVWSSSHKGMEGTSDKDGKIAIDGITPGKFVFQIQASGYLNRSPNRNFNYWELELADGMPPLKIELERVVRITGVVQDPGGSPVAGATVAPADGAGNSLTGDTSFSVATAKDGTFVIELPASGAAKYNLEAHDGNQAQWRQWANGVLPPIQTKPGDESKNVVIKLTRPAIVRGHVKDETGKPLVEREVRASAADMLENRYYDPTTKTDKDGNFELRFIRPGKQFIQAGPFFWCNVPEGGMTLKLKDGETNSLLVTLKEGQTKSGVQLTAPASTKFPSHDEQLRRAIEKMEGGATQPKAKAAEASRKADLPAAPSQRGK